MENTIAVIDSMSLPDLLIRYGIGRTMFQNRINAIGMKPEKRGNRSYFSQSQIQQLDQQDLRIKNGEALTVSEPIEGITNFLEPIDLDSLLNPHRVLQEVSDNEWVLSTAIVRLLVGSKPYGTVYQKMGFVFTRTDRIGEWFVSKLEKKQIEEGIKVIEVGMKVIRISTGIVDVVTEKSAIGINGRRFAYRVKTGFGGNADDWFEGKLLKVKF
jgi:hypothetical protein